MPQGRGTPKRSKKSGRNRRKPAWRREQIKFLGHADKGEGGKLDGGLYTQGPAGR